MNALKRVFNQLYGGYKMQWADSVKQIIAENGGQIDHNVLIQEMNTRGIGRHAGALAQLAKSGLWRVSVRIVDGVTHVVYVTA